MLWFRDDDSTYISELFADLSCKMYNYSPLKKIIKTKIRNGSEDPS